MLIPPYNCQLQTFLKFVCYKSAIDTESLSSTLRDINNSQKKTRDPIIHYHAPFWGEFCYPYLESELHKNMTGAP